MMTLLEYLTENMPPRPTGYERASPKLHATFGIATTLQRTQPEGTPFKQPHAIQLGIPLSPSAADILPHARKAHGLALVFEAIVHTEMSDDKYIREFATEVADRFADTRRQVEVWAETGRRGDFWSIGDWATFRTLQLGDRLEGAPASIRVVHELVDAAACDLHHAAGWVDAAEDRKRRGYHW